jgi:hypothetical protein
MVLFALKLALVAASIIGATAAARRWGHRVSGLMAGRPMIIGPITAILLFDQSAERVRAILLATLQCQPAMLLHVLAFAHAARRLAWPLCLVLANALYLLLAWALTRLGLEVALATALVAAVWLGSVRAWPPTGEAHSGRVSVPRSELWWRVGTAVAVAAGVILGAGTMPPAFGGVLLALPITGNVLPVFTLPRHGPQATAQLLRGFLHGQLGFAAFVVAMVLLLPVLPAAAAFALAVVAALLAPWLYGPRRRQLRGGSSPPSR